MNISVGRCACPVGAASSTSTVGQDAEAELDAVKERVHRGSTALNPAGEAVATRAPVVGRRIDCLWRAPFDHLSLHAAALQRPVLEHRGDCGPDLGDGRRLGGILEFGHGAPSSGRWAGGCLPLSVLLDQLYRLSRSPAYRPGRRRCSRCARRPRLRARGPSRAADVRPGPRLDPVRQGTGHRIDPASRCAASANVGIAAASGVSDGTRTRGRRDHNPTKAVPQNAVRLYQAGLSAAELP